ncbi:MAG: DUF4236 domain-containing protein [Acidobacteriota bacterium]
MPLRFWRSIKIAPGLRLNLSKRGASVSVGPRGAHLTMGTSGARYSVGLPGTGLSYGDKIGGARRAAAAPARKGARPPKDLDISFLEKLTVSGAEQSFVQGLKALKEERAGDALRHLESATSLPDACYMAGVAALKLERYPEARTHLERALARGNELGSLFAQYDFDATVELPIAAGYTEVVGPDVYGATLMLVEVCQKLGAPSDALPALTRLAAEVPASATAALSRAEILLEAGDAEGALQALTDKNAPEPLLTALRAYRGRALRELGLLKQSLDAMVVTSREVKKISGPSGRAMRYERALTLEALGRAADARDELEAIYAEDPAYEDVARRIGRA